MPTKTLNVTFTAAEYGDLEDVKGDRTWHEAIREEFGIDGE